jgi:hypothetical protein
MIQVSFVIFGPLSCHCNGIVTPAAPLSPMSSSSLASSNAGDVGESNNFLTKQHSLTNDCNSTKVGDGICDEGTMLNTQECDWDGGDCILSKYPNCRVSFPSKIGNGICDEEYNTLDCGRDGGDCQDLSSTTTANHTDSPSDRKRRSPGQVAGIVMGSMAVVALVLFSQWIFVQSRNQYSNLVGVPHPNGSSTSNPVLISMVNGRTRRTPAALFTWGGMTRNSVRWDKEKRQERIRLVRKNIICKKVLPLLSTKASASSSVVDCHLSIGSHHSWISKGHNDDDEDDDVSMVVDCGSPRRSFPQKVNRKNHHRKDNIYIDCTHPTAAAASIHSLRHGMKVASSHHSLYSPRCCPICYEEYRIGDDIAWSQNDECPHMYHLNCILEWLLDKDDCPMCRAKYINIDVEEGEEDEEDNEESSSTMVMQEFPISIPMQVPMGNESGYDLHDEEEAEEQEEGSNNNSAHG